MAEKDIITINRTEQDKFIREIDKLNDILASMEGIKEKLYNSVVDEEHKTMFSTLKKYIYNERDKLEKKITELAKSINKITQKKFKFTS